MERLLLSATGKGHSRLGGEDGIDDAGLSLSRILPASMGTDRFLPQDQLLALASLLKEALAIKHDLTGRIAQHPNQKSLLKQHKEYQQLVARLSWELDRELTGYLARIKALRARLPVQL